MQGGDSEAFSGTPPSGADSEPLAVVSLTDDLAKDFGDWVSLSQDLRFVMTCLERAGEGLRAPEGEQDDVAVRAYFSAALIAYARCFGGGKRRRLEPEVIYLHLEGEPVDVHKHLIDLRSKHHAHSVNAFEGIGVGVLLPAQRSEGIGVVGVVALRMTHFSFDDEGLKQFWWLTKTALEFALEQARIARSAVLAYAEALPIESLYAAPDLRLYAPGPEEAGRPRA